MYRKEMRIIDLYGCLPQSTFDLGLFYLRQ
jgi:hypothetical protein